MTPDTANPASAAARTGSGDAICFDGERFPDSTHAQNTQVKLQAEFEFDADIALALIDSGLRATDYLLINAAQLIQAGDFQNAENARQSARQQFLLANSIWRQFQETRATEAVSIFAAEGFR